MKRSQRPQRLFGSTAGTSTPRRSASAPGIRASGPMTERTDNAATPSLLLVNTMRQAFERARASCSPQMDAQTNADFERHLGRIEGVPPERDSSECPTGAVEERASPCDHAVDRFGRWTISSGRQHPFGRRGISECRVGSTLAPMRRAERRLSQVAFGVDKFFPQCEHGGAPGTLRERSNSDVARTPELHVKVEVRWPQPSDAREHTPVSSRRTLSEPAPQPPSSQFRGGGCTAPLHPGVASGILQRTDAAAQAAQAQQRNLEFQASHQLSSHGVRSSPSTPRLRPLLLSASAPTADGEWSVSWNDLGPTSARSVPSKSPSGRLQREVVTKLRAQGAEVRDRIAAEDVMPLPRPQLKWPGARARYVRLIEGAQTPREAEGTQEERSMDQSDPPSSGVILPPPRASPPRPSAIRCPEDLAAPLFPDVTISPIPHAPATPEIGAQTRPLELDARSLSRPCWGREDRVLVPETLHRPVETMGAAGSLQNTVSQPTCVVGSPVGLGAHVDCPHWVQTPGSAASTPSGFRCCGVTHQADMSPRFQNIDKSHTQRTLERDGALHSPHTPRYESRPSTSTSRYLPRFDDSPDLVGSATFSNVFLSDVQLSPHRGKICTEAESALKKITSRNSRAHVEQPGDGGHAFWDAATRRCPPRRLEYVSETPHVLGRASSVCSVVESHKVSEPWLQTPTCQRYSFGPGYASESAALGSRLGSHRDTCRATTPRRLARAASAAAALLTPSVELANDAHSRERPREK
eukprot:CAMPEP_0194539870 /NCGR_PEP_ID=MMETSP0253-20130528/79934_1 /TAXON_ID=2966 /ORGANISM="Noctiluca scintillans" /LENGTH=751 /DNA_ID=CAMNT_0039386193 /DNA_START=56 /DNA_END=2312 /DNA_ORIENTATION=+